jgi:hypothetical protein
MRSFIDKFFRPLPVEGVAPAGGWTRRRSWPSRDGSAADARSWDLVTLALCFAAALGVAAVPVLLAKLPVLEDYPNHLARAYIIAVHGQHTLLDRFYDIDWRMVPDLAFDLVVPPLARAVGIYAAGKIFILLTLALLLAGPLAIHRALFGRYSPAPLVAAIFLYNPMLLGGLLSYFFTLGCALCAIAAWIALRGRSPALRGAVSCIAATALFVGHLVAFGIYGVALLCFEAWCFLSRRPGPHYRTVDALAFALPFAIPAVFLALGGSSGGAFSATWDFGWKIGGLWLAVSSTAKRIDAVVVVFLLSSAIFLWRRGRLQFHPAALPLALGSGAVYLAMPLVFMESWGADLRLATAGVFLFIGFVSIRLDSAATRAMFLGVLLVLVALRAGLVERQWRASERIFAEIERSMASIEPGSTVLVARENRALPGPISYFPCLVIIERSSLCALEFSDPGKWILVVKPAYRQRTALLDNPPLLDELRRPPRSWAEVDLSHDPTVQPVYWANWRSDYDYVYLLAADPDPMPAALHLVTQGTGFQLYRVIRP